MQHCTTLCGNQATQTHSETQTYHLCDLEANPIKQYTLDSPRELRVCGHSARWYSSMVRWVYALPMSASYSDTQCVCTSGARSDNTRSYSHREEAG